MLVSILFARLYWLERCRRHTGWIFLPRAL